MRDIKFKYYYENIFRKEIITKIRDIDEIESIEFDIVNLESSHLKLLNRCLFTGMIDKNGKEIYEGDIVKENDDLFVVCYIDREASYYAIPCNTKSIDEDCMRYKTPYEAFLNGCHCIEFDNLYDKQVVGNIYENQEILKGGNDE